MGYWFCLRDEWDHEGYSSDDTEDEDDKVRGYFYA